MLMAIVVVYLFGLGVLGLVSLWWFRREVHRARVARMLLARRLVRTARRVTLQSRALRRRITGEHAVWEDDALWKADGLVRGDPFFDELLECLRPTRKLSPALRELIHLAVERRKQASRKPRKSVTD